MSNQSLEIWQTWPEAYKPEIARASFLQFTIYSKMNTMDRGSRAILAQAKAFRLRKACLKAQGIPDRGGGMSIEEFDKM
ncbi:MAG: hypothetical protein Q9188_007467, partial [Gyalolechia gomerana]